MNNHPSEQHPSDWQLQELLDGELAPPETADLRTHLATCPICSLRLDELRQLFASIEALPPAALVTDLTLGVLARIARGQLPPAIWGRPQPQTWLHTHLILPVQFIASLGLIFMFWPVASLLLRSLFQRLEMLPAASNRLVEMTVFISGGWRAVAELIRSSMEQGIEAALDLAWLPEIPVFSGLPAGVLLAAVTLLWFVGNGLLIGKGSYLRRNK